MSVARQIADEKFAVHYSGGPGSKLRLLTMGSYTMEAWLRPAHPTGLTVYAEPLFTGVSRRLPHGRYDNMAGFAGNGNFGSVEVPPGVTAILFDGPGCKGNARRITGDAAGMAEWAGKVKSLLVMDRFHARQAYAVFYAAAGYGGQAVAVAPGIFADTKGLGFAPACADLPPGVAVQVYAGAGLTGESAVIDGDHVALWEKWAGRVQSMAVRLGAARQFRGGQTGVARVLTADDDTGLRLEMEQVVNGLRPPSWLFYGRKLNDGHWHHLGFARQNGFYAAYLDGLKVAEGALAFQDTMAFRLAAEFRGRVALARVWDRGVDPDALLEHRFALYDAPFPADLRLSCRVNDAGTSLREVVAGAEVALPAGAVIVHAHLPVDPMRSGLGQKMSLAMQAHGGEELKKAREEQAATVAKAHADTAAQMPMRQARARMEARLGALLGLVYVERPSVYFSQNQSMAESWFVRREFNPKYPLRAANGATMSRPVLMFAMPPVDAEPVVTMSVTPGLGAWVIDDTARSVVYNYELLSNGKLMLVKRDSNGAVLEQAQVLLESATPSMSPFEFFNRRWSMALDYDRQILYWSDGRYLYRGQLTAERKLGPVEGGYRIPSKTGAVLPAPIALAVEPVTGDLIWVDAAVGRVLRLHFATGEIQDLYPAPNPRSALGIDAGTGALFWCSEQAAESELVAVDRPGLFYSFQDFDSNGKIGVQLPFRTEAFETGNVSPELVPVGEVYPVKVDESDRLFRKMPARQQEVRAGLVTRTDWCYSEQANLIELFDVSMRLSRGFSLSVWTQLQESAPKTLILLAPLATAAADLDGWQFRLTGVVRTTDKPSESLSLVLRAGRAGQSYQFYGEPLGAEGVTAMDWMNITVSVRGREVAAYVNGKPLVLEIPKAEEFPAELAALGERRYRALTCDFKAKVVNVRYWDRPITAAEAAEVFRLGLSAKPHLNAGDRMFDAGAPRPVFRQGQAILQISPKDPLRLPRMALDFQAGLTAEFWILLDDWLPEVNPTFFSVRPPAGSGVKTEYAPPRFNPMKLRMPFTTGSPSGWQHIVLAGDRHGAAWYFNAMFVDAEAPVVNLDRGEYDIVVDGYQGQIAVCRFYNRKLSFAEIEKLRDAGPGEVPVLARRGAAPADDAVRSRTPYIMMGDVDGKDPCVPFRQADAQFGFGIRSNASKLFFEHVKALHELHAAEAKARKDQQHAEEQRTAQVGAAQTRRNQDVAHGHQMVDSKQAETEAARAAENEKKRQASNDADARRSSADRDALASRTSGQQQADAIRDDGQRRHDQIVGDANSKLSAAQAELAKKEREKREKMGG